MKANYDEVICPNCVTQFRAVPVNVQHELITLRAENEKLRLDAERYRALTNNCRSKYIWNNVFTDDQRDLGNDVESVLDALAALGEKT